MGDQADLQAGPIPQAVPIAPAPAVRTSLDHIDYLDRYKSCGLEIPEFEGKSTLSSESFIVKSEIAFEAWGIHAADQLRLASAKLKGEAVKLQVEFKQTGNAPSSFAELAARLRARFPVPTEETPAYVLLHTTAMQGNRLAKYIQDFNQQSGRLGSGNPGLRDLLYELFLSKLAKDLRRVVEQSRPEQGWESMETLQQATLRAQQTLHLQGTREPTNSGSSAGSGGKRPSGGDPPGQGFSKRQKVEGFPWCERCKRNTHNTVDCNTFPGNKRGRGGGRGNRGNHGRTNMSKNS